MLQILTCRMDIAEKYGLDAAVLLHNIVYWTEKNAAENRHFHKGRYWMYATIKGFAQMYPLWSESQIRRIISRLRDSGALLVGEFNENRMLRTIWYSPSDEILSLYETGYDSESISHVTIDGKTRKTCKLKIIQVEAGIDKLIFGKFLETCYLT